MQILAILNPIQVRHRVLKKGHRYFPPPTRGTDVLDITLDQLQIMRNKIDAKDLDVLRWLGRNISIPKKFVEEIARRAGISASNVGQLSNGDMSKIYTVIKELVADISAGSHEALVILGDDSMKEFLAANSALIVIDKGRKYLEVLGERVPTTDSSFAKISSLLFGRAKELERGCISIEDAKARLYTQLGNLRSKTTAIQDKIVIKEQIAKEWYERYRWFITSEGLLAIGGRDASSNSAIIRKHLTENDIVFHAEVHGSPFFILKDAKQVSEISASHMEVAQATVSFSRAWKDGLFSADAYWVYPSQIKKGAPTGQFVPRGSFVIEGKRSYIKGIEIKLAVGLIWSLSRYVLACGPTTAIRKHSLVYTQLLPGGTDPDSVGKKIKAELVKAAYTNT